MISTTPLPTCRWRNVRPDGTLRCLSACVVVLDADPERTCRACPLPDKDCRSAANISSAAPDQTATSGPGTEIAKIFQRLGISGCQQCSGLAAKMDAWGVDGCQQRLDEIVADILPRAKQWADRRWITSLAPGFVLREVIKSHVLTAIDRAARHDSSKHAV